MGLRYRDIIFPAADNAGKERPKLLITECGVGTLANPYAGWLGNLETDRYVGRLMGYANMIEADPEVIGACVFTAGTRFEEPSVHNLWGGFDVDELDSKWLEAKCPEKS